MSTILAGTDLVVRYNERAILRSATLGIDECDRIGLVGRNGSGKTTFLRILAGLQSPDSGEVTGRRDLVVSYLSQDFTLEPSLDVRGNVRRGAWRTLDLIAEFEALPGVRAAFWSALTDHPPCLTMLARAISTGRRLCCVA